MTDTLAITEKQFSQQVVDLARLLGWKVYRQWTSIHSPKGFPDLTMVREDRLVFAELKSEQGKLTEAQAEWLEALRATGIGRRIFTGVATPSGSGKVEVYEWRPHQIEEIAGILQGGEA